MDAVIRGAVVYLFLLLIFRLAGKRSLAQVTTFDFILLLIIAETIQEAIIANDRSITNSALLILTLIGLDLVFSLVKQRSRSIEKLLDDVPLVLVKAGEPIRERMDKVRVDENDILAAARETQGLRRMDEIEYAVLERSGAISIIPKHR